ncbi:thiamine biosynthesis protein ApbE [Petrotoga sp. 8T1HF07.NaAc.6.1]|uniref:FAD:protein FMN transferase n=1 Tax=Petrotoga sp. 8T1HF07.NaAc.6.1 TaxID=1351838 RepID=UPI00192B687F|nr:FAD:protein FMN transferase [Petrotoga sp. 8T1HF07.NaAc.6.1]MBL5981486.1 thiamine biosynthesis protein ApbE [Petrotoga sp. 8T1HF07.NaAc.6.1]
MRQKNMHSLRVYLYIAALGVGVLLLSLLLFSKPTPVYEEKEFPVLGTIVRVKVAGDKVSSNVLLNTAEQELYRLHNKFSPNVEGSIIQKLNTDRKVEVDEEGLFLFQATYNYAVITGGAFDPTVRPLLKLWGFDDINSPKKVPIQEEINRTLENVDYRFIKIDEEKREISLLKDGVEVDLGGIAKGYAIDLVIQKIKEIDPGATGFVDAGGDIGIIGPKFGELAWVIGIRDPFSQDVLKSIDTIYLTSGAVATSGDYERFFIEDGKKYHHILDPEDGYPAGNASSVTVIAEKAMIADVFSTALFVLGYDNPALDYFTDFGIQALIISPTGESTETSGFDYFREKM